MAVVTQKWEELLKESKPRDIPDELVVDILSRLPVRSIMRFKAACKTWCSLFSDPQFIEMHLKQAIAAGKFCFVARNNPIIEHGIGNLQGDDEALTAQAPSNAPRSRITGKIYSSKSVQPRQELAKGQGPKFGGYHAVVGSCNGIICLTECDTTRIYASLNFTLWNPATRDVRSIPFFSPNNDSSLVDVVTVGFLYNQKINDYKAVGILQSDDPKSNNVVVYSLMKDSWKEFNIPLCCAFSDRICRVYVNGIMHWLVYNTNKYKHKRYFILSFDVAEEKFNRMKMPRFDPSKSYARLQRSPSSLGESLIVYIYKYRRREECQKWFMEEYGDARTWTSLYYIPPSNELCMPDCLFHNGVPAMMNVDWNDRGPRLFSWDPSVQVLTAREIVPPTVEYVESLVSVKGSGNSSDLSPCVPHFKRPRIEA